MFVRGDIYLSKSFRSTVIVLNLLIVFMSGGSLISVSGAEGRDLDLASKILISAVGVNNSRLTRKQ